MARASEQIIARAKIVAAERLEAGVGDVEFDPRLVPGGGFRVAGTDLQISLTEVAELAAGSPDGDLDETCLYERPTECNFPNGCHVCEVEIDPDTGVMAVVSYHAVDDCGRLLNPLLVEGQVHGGVAMGLGQALTEYTAYDRESGQLVSGTYMDYGIPRADDMPWMDVAFHEVWNPSNDLGVKGAGEGGACGAPPAIVGAISDALRDYGVRHVDMPVRSEDLWRILNGAAERS